MTIDKDKDFTLTHYLNITAQRETTLSQVPFFLGALKHNPPVLRRILEAILAAVCWTITDVAALAYNVVEDDVVLLVDTSAAATDIQLQGLADSCGSGRIIVVKDASGDAGANNITIAPQVGEVFEGASLTATISVPFGVLIFIAGTAGGGLNTWYVLSFN